MNTIDRHSRLIIHSLFARNTYISYVGPDQKCLMSFLSPFCGTYSDQSIPIQKQKGKRKIQGVPQSQAAAHPSHDEEEETDKTKPAQIEKKQKQQRKKKKKKKKKTYEKH